MRGKALKYWSVKWLAAAMLLLISWKAQANMEDAVVRVRAEIRTSPALIKLVWTSVNTQPTGYSIWRKAKTSTAWGSPVATLPLGSASEYSDNTVAVGQAYEYRIRRTDTGGEGYIFAGIEVPAQHQRGTLVLVVDNTHATALATELQRLEQDLIGDGWQVIRHDVAPTSTPPQVKALIAADYQADPAGVKAVFLLGHVPIPYSGQLFPDGHTNHVGAWPADAYYGDMVSSWTDTQVNIQTAFRPENYNVPGDGKFDRTQLNGMTLQVGRVDLSDLPAFALNEQELLRRYLQKDHDFRHRVFAVRERALITDNFFNFNNEGFANNGWRNFSPLVGESNITEGPYFSTLATQDYLMAYGCGNGSFTSASGVGSTTDFANQTVKSVFNMMFGSYFGDWDFTDNFLRAAIAGSGYSLTNCWAGRPNWQYHHMGLGETAGYATYVTQNIPYLYTLSGGSGQVHVALMGDPSLRLHTLAPATALATTTVNGGAVLSWTASPEAVLGYYVYRSASPTGPFTQVTAQPVAATTYTDATPLPGPSTYMVRAVQLKTSNSGSYHNLSQGVFANFTAPAAIVPTWLGTVSSSWSNPANWNTGVVPGALTEVVIPAGTPFAPSVNGTFSLSRLNLVAGAQLTVAAGASLTVQYQPDVQLSTGNTPTRLVLAAGTATTPGGLLEIKDHTGSTGLALATGTLLTVGDYAELRLVGSLFNTGGTVSFSRFGRLAFTSDAAQPGQALQHDIFGLSTMRIGVLVVTHSVDVLLIDSAVEVAGQIENQGNIVTNNNLTLLSSPGQQAILAPVVQGASRTLGTYTGNVRVQVYVDGSRNAGLGYRHLAAPVHNATVGALSTSSFTPVVNPLFNSVGNTVTPFPTVYSYSQSRVDSARVPGPVGFDQGWRSPSGLFDPLTYGRGYSVNMRGNNTLSFMGSVITGNSPISSPFNLALDRGANPAAGWHLLGNPFVAPLDWDQLVANNRLSNANTALYVFKSSGRYSGSYASYVPGINGGPGVGLNGGTNVIPVGQGFFVQANPGSGGASGGSIAFHLNDLLTAANATAVQRTAVDTRPRLVLALQNQAQTVAHQTAIYFQAGATAGIDAAYDAAYLPGPEQPVALTSALAGSSFSINGLPALTGADVTVPLQLRARTAGQYQLVVETLANLPAGYRAYLLDASTSSLVDLAGTALTPVALPTNTVVSRYSIVFSTQPRVLATAPASLAALVSLFPNPAHGHITLLLPPALRGPHPAPVAVCNALGQRVWTGTFQGQGDDGMQVPLGGLRPGVYTMQVQTVVGLISRRFQIE